MLETALSQELTEHLGHEKRSPAAAGNVRSGTRSKTVITEASGQVPIEVPRDRDGSFEPQIVRKRQRRLSGVDEMVLSLYAKGLTTREISAHFAEIYVPLPGHPVPGPHRNRQDQVGHALETRP